MSKARKTNCPMPDDKPCQSTDPRELERQIMSECVPKNEREWWAKKRIEELQDFADNSSENQVGAQVIPDALPILIILSEINEIAEHGILPDGDSVTEPTRLWAEDAAKTIKENYKIVFQKV